MVYRRTTHLSLFVLNEESDFGSNVTQSFSMSISPNDEMIVSADFVSESDFEEHIVFTGMVSNILWYAKDFSDDFVLRPSEDKHIELNLGKIPSYKWLFNLEVEWFYQPYFWGIDLNIDIDADWIKDATTFSESATLFVYSHVLLIIVGSILFLLLLILLLLFRKRKVVYVKA